MDSVATPAAPAQPDPTPAPVLTAVESAVVHDNVPAYREARRAERSGTPAPAPVPAEPVQDPPTPAPAAVEEPRTVSKRQLQINAYERRIAEQDQRIRALEAGSAIPPPPAASRTEPPASETFPLYAQYLDTHPDASLEDYIDARQDWRDGVKAKATSAQRAEADSTRSQQEQIEQAHARTIAARQADPVLDAKFAAWETPGADLPEILTIQTRAQAIAARVVPVAVNDFASAIATSEYSAQIIAHVADHPDVLEKVRALVNRTAVNKFVGKLETRFEKADEAAAPVHVPKTISSAPAPGTPLGSRPASAADPLAAAVKGGDFTAYRATRRAERSARR